MPCKSATVPAAVNPVNFYDITRATAPISIAIGKEWEGVIKRDKSEDLPSIFSTFVFGRKGTATFLMYAFYKPLFGKLLS